MFCYASTETKELMPLPIQLAHKLALQLATVRKKKAQGIDWLRPDGKTQVSVRYEDDRPVALDAIVVSTQHAAHIKPKQIEEAMRELVVAPVVPKSFVTPKTKFHINPTGRFVIGGPRGDSGLTGRKIIVDTYGGFARHGGGSFSGKDPTKVDRSGAYMARYVAKNVVAAGLARRCELQLAYAISVAHPLAVNVETFGTGRIADERIVALIGEHFDLRPGAIIETLGLRAPIYRQTAAYGHFGRHDLDLPWERTDRAQALRDASGVRGEASLRT